MSLRSLLVWLTRIIVAVATFSTTYLYLYPVWFGCAFPSTTGSTYDGFKQTVAQHARQASGSPFDDCTIAPFRLLVLADPQLEGDSSFPDPDDALLARLGSYWDRLRKTPLSSLNIAAGEITKELFYEDVPQALWTARKTLDLFGNDYYLAHIYRTLRWWTAPSHVTVLGDLVGSQWVNDAEFEWRGWRYWNRVFAGSEKVDDKIIKGHDSSQNDRLTLPLYAGLPFDWSNRIVNIVGNHDIGYAGDISRARIERFEREFGSVNWDVHFEYPNELIPDSYKSVGQPTPSLHLIVFNSMLLDTPVLDAALQGDTYDYINNLITSRLDPVESRNTTFTLLLTHVPLHKPEGICVDAPFFEFWDHSEADGAYKQNGLKEQNHLSEHTSHSGVLQGLYGMSGDIGAPAGGKGRNGLILTGHDHAGCDTVHYVERKVETIFPEQPEAFHESGSDLAGGEEDWNERATEPQQSLTWSWKSIRTSDFPQRSTLLEKERGQDIVTSLREITLRSMMGEFGGNAGLLSVWYDFAAGMWKYEVQMCPLGVQHIWWAVHITDIVAITLFMVRTVSWVFHKNEQTLVGEPAKGTRTTEFGAKGEHRPIDRVKASEKEEENRRSSSRRRRRG